MISAGPEASGFQSVIEAATVMASVSPGMQDMIRVRSDRTQLYDPLYKSYRRLASYTTNQSQPHP